EGDTLNNIENLTGSAFDDTLEGNAGNNVLAGGLGIFDTISYEHATSGVRVSIFTNHFQNTSLATGTGTGTDVLSGFENITASDFDDRLEGPDDPNVIIGGAGNDFIQGNGGPDDLRGGLGSDTFRLLKPSDSLASLKTQPDIIEDFHPGEDKLDFSAIDANVSKGAFGDQPFLFAGQNASVVANSVTWFVSGNFTHIQADIDGDTTADIAVVLVGNDLSLSELDFIL